MPKLLSARELADVLQVGPSWLVERAKRGALPGYKLGRHWRFDAAQVSDWLTAQGNHATRTVERREVLPSRRVDPAKAPTFPVDPADTVPDKEVAEHFQVPVTAVRGWIAEDLLPGLHVGRRWHADRRCFEKWKAILAKEAPRLADYEAGRHRTELVRERMQYHLMKRYGIKPTPTPRSWQRHGGRVPTWSEVYPR